MDLSKFMCEAGLLRNMHGSCIVVIDINRYKYFLRQLSEELRVCVCVCVLQDCIWLISVVSYVILSQLTAVFT